MLLVEVLNCIALSPSLPCRSDSFLLSQYQEAPMALDAILLMSPLSCDLQPVSSCVISSPDVQVYRDQVLAYYYRNLDFIADESNAFPEHAEMLRLHHQFLVNQIKFVSNMDLPSLGDFGCQRGRPCVLDEPVLNHPFFEWLGFTDFDRFVSYLMNIKFKQSFWLGHEA